MWDWPVTRNLCCSKMALHFYTFVPVMKNHLSHKTTFCGPGGLSLIAGFTVYIHIVRYGVPASSKARSNRRWDLAFIVWNSEIEYMFFMHARYYISRSNIFMKKVFFLVSHHSSLRISYKYLRELWPTSSLNNVKGSILTINWIPSSLNQEMLTIT